MIEGTTAQRRKDSVDAESMLFFFFITSNSAKRAQSLGVVGNRVTKVFDFHK